MTTPLRVAINGFGRIGRALTRVLSDHPSLHVVHVNDPIPLEQAEYLLKFDSVMPALRHEVESQDHVLTVRGRPIAMTHATDVTTLPWRNLGVDYVVNSSGVQTDRRALQTCLDRGALRVFISAPSSFADVHVLAGVNDESLLATHRIVSGGSCTAHCFAPIVKLIAERHQIERGFLQTVHAYTSSQNLIDGPHASDPRRGRAAAGNIVPTTTEAVRAFEDALPQFRGLLQGMAMRVPVMNGSNIDLVLQLRQAVSRDQINREIESAAQGKLSRILAYSRDWLVSSDVIGSPFSCIFDSRLTQSHGSLLRVFLWYDNEWGYANRFADLLALAARQDTRGVNR